MSKQNLTISALAAVLVLGMAAFAVAGPGAGAGRGPGCGQGALYSQLTPEKQAEANAIFDKYEPQFEGIRNQMWAKRSVLQAMVNGGNADEKAITKLVNDISKLRDQMRDLRKAMSDELVQATGLTAFGDFGPCQRYAQTDCPGYGQNQGRMGNGMGYGRGMMN